MLDVINFTEARNNLKSVLDKVVDDANVTIIARRAAPNAVVMSLDTYNSIMETAYLLKSPANAQRLVRSIEQHRAVDAVEQTLIDDTHRIAYAVEELAIVIDKTVSKKLNFLYVI